MNKIEDIAIIIPSRLASTRLPNKAILDIAGQSLIERVARQALKTNIKHIYVATDSEEIAQKVAHLEVGVIMTDPDLPSGTDRVFEAYQKLPNKEQFHSIINVQGDMPFVNPKGINILAESLSISPFDMHTIAKRITPEEAQSDSIVKVVFDGAGKALYFSRAPIPYNAKDYYYHIGVYGFKPDSLAKYVAEPQSPLEIIERAEQIRFLENNMTIGISLVEESVPLSVDVPDDLRRAEIFAKENEKIIE